VGAFNAFGRIIERRRVIVNLTDGSSFEGVLYRQDGPLLVLKNATYLEPRQQPVPLDGDTIIERDRVLFIQAP
jgi:small nuclear ribonucleoprotein (snRNP)-like protein